MDRNHNGTIETDEIERMPGPLRDRLSSGGFNLSQPIARDHFMRLLQERMQSRGGGSDERGPGGDDRRGDDRRGGPGGSFGRPDGFGSRMMGMSGGSSMGGNLMSIRMSPGGFTPGYSWRGSSDRSSRRGSESSEGSVTKPRPRVTIPLPEEYGERDKNGDGQVSFCEWRQSDRSALAEFFILDRNGDGFLVPRELVSSDEKASNGTSKPAAKQTQSVVIKPSGTSASSGGGSATVEDQQTRRANYYFDRLDSNDDGSVTLEEWSISRRIKPMFEQAKIDLSKPMSKEQFVKDYVRLSMNSGG